MDIYSSLVVIHILGTILGVGGATFIEIFLTKSLRDGKVDATEGGFLKITFIIVRIGLVLSLFSGIGFLLLYKFSDQAFRIYNPVLWAKLSIIAVIIINALLLQAHKISLYWGSSLSLVSWYFAFIIGALSQGPFIFYSYTDIIIPYILSMIVGAFVLERIRIFFKKTTQ